MREQRARQGGRSHARCWLLGIAAALAVAATGCAQPDPPNVLVYVIDTLRVDELEPYGSQSVATPAIQRLADEGIVYERAYAPSSWTRPSIASILTGLAPDVHGVETRRHHAPPSLELLSEHFHAAGYATAAIVTNPNVGRFFGFDQGYDDFIELFMHESEGGVAGFGAKSNLVTNRAIEWLRGARKPFFLVLHTTDPHWPYDPPERFDPLRSDPALARTTREIEATRDWSDKEHRDLRALYRGEIALNDESLGDLLNYLRRAGTYDETIIVVTSDHGEEFGEHGDKGHGKTLFEEQVHVPLILRRPAETQPGKRIALPIQLIDLAPTILHLAGLDAGGDLPGQVLPPEGTPQPRPIYASVRLDTLQGQMLLEPPWKMIHHSPIRERERPIRQGLFHLADDAGEVRDLRDQEPERSRAMSEQLDRLAEEAKQRAVERRAKRRAQRGAPAPEDREVPDELRRSLEALGYLDPAE